MCQLFPTVSNRLGSFTNVFVIIYRQLPVLCRGYVTCSLHFCEIPGVRVSFCEGQKRVSHANLCRYKYSTQSSRLNTNTGAGGGCGQHGSERITSESCGRCFYRRRENSEGPPRGWSDAGYTAEHRMYYGYRTPTICIDFLKIIAIIIISWLELYWFCNG